MKNNEVVKDNKDAKDEMYDVHVSSPWFKMKIDDISWKTIIIVGMILGAIVFIIKG